MHIRPITPYRTLVHACLLALALLFLRAGPALASELPADIAQAVSEYDSATIHNDVVTLGRLFADDYVQVNSDATLEDKQRALADFLMPGFSVDPYVTEQPIAIVWPAGVVISGIVHLSWTQDGRHQTRTVRMAHVWAKRNGHWRMTTRRSRAFRHQTMRR